MIETPEVPEQHQPQSSQPVNRLTTLGHRVDGGPPCLLLVIQEAGGSWTIHGVGDTAIRLTGERMAALAGAILVRVR